MEDLDKIYEGLAREIIKNYSFFLSYNFLNQESVVNLLRAYNIGFTQKFVDTYVNQLLYLDENLDMQVLESYEVIKNYYFIKSKRLNKNSFKLVYLKDTLGNASFNYIFDKYIEILVYANEFCNFIEEDFYISYPDNKQNPTFLFKEQKAIIQGHLYDIENKIGVKGGKINKEEIINHAINSSVFKPYLEEYLNVLEPINTKPSENKEDNTIKPFRDFIKHEKNVEIEKLVKQHFSDYRGVTLRYLLEYFIEKKVLVINTGDQKKLHESITNLFEGKNIAHPNSIFPKKVFNSFDPNYKDSKKVFDEVFINIM